MFSGPKSPPLHFPQCSRINARYYTTNLDFVSPEWRRSDPILLRLAPTSHLAHRLFLSSPRVSLLHPHSLELWNYSWPTQHGPEITTPIGSPAIYIFRSIFLSVRKHTFFSNVSKHSVEDRHQYQQRNTCPLTPRLLDIRQFKRGC